MKHGKPTAIPPAIPETEEEQRRYREAGETTGNTGWRMRNRTR